MRSVCQLLCQIVVATLILPGCSRHGSGGDNNPALGEVSNEAEKVPASWRLQDCKFADGFFGKGQPQARLFVGGQPQAYETTQDPGAQLWLRPQISYFCGWKEDEDHVYSARFEGSTHHADVKSPAERVKRIADLLTVLDRWHVFENTRRDIDHHGRPGCELEYSRIETDMAKSPLSIVVRVIYVAENETVCVFQVSSRKPGPAIRADDPKVRAFLTRSEIVIPKKPTS